MIGREQRLTVIRARFSLDIRISQIDEIVGSLRSGFRGNRRIEVYRQVGLPRDIQWLIYPDESSYPDGDLFCDRLIASLKEFGSVDRTVWQIL